MGEEVPERSRSGDLHTRSQLEHQLEVFPALERRRCEVVENGWEPADHATSAPASASPSERALSIAFVGTFPAFTPPGGFLATVEAAVRARPDLKAQLRILLVGRKHPSVLEPLQRFAHAEMLECIGEVPRPQAIRIMRSASALLLFNPPELARYVPGKLYEYLAARRPILVFGNGGEAATLVQELAAGVTIEPGDFKSLTRAVDGLAAGTLRRPSGAEINSWLAAHTRERMTAQFFAVLEALPRS